MSNPAERTMRTLRQTMRALLADEKHNWKELLPGINLALNSSFHNTTKYSPYFLIFGQPPRLQRSIIFGEELNDSEDQNTYAAYFIERLKKSSNCPTKFR